ncbi:MAG: DUF3108 domain-containing protein [Pyrinomonadaceae bacterium]
MLCSLICLASLKTPAQQVISPYVLRIGEKITYTVSFERFPNVAYAEIGTYSRGRLGNQDAVELRGKFKTIDFFGAAFYSVDESRTVFIDPVTGMPLYVSSINNLNGLPRETITNYLGAPSQGFDLLSLIYKIRQTGGSGSASLFENGRLYGVTTQPFGTERAKTEAGEFDSTIVTVQSDYLTERGIKDMRIDLSNDENRVPVIVRIKTEKGELRLSAATVQLAIPEAEPLPLATATPIPTPMPKVIATPLPYVENQPLAAELAFDLGESLEYRLSVAGRPIGNFVIQAAERKQVDGRDSLLLHAIATQSAPGNRAFVVGDTIFAQVNPDTLAPRRAEIRSNGSLSSYNQSIQFDPGTGAITMNAGRVDAPIGTHTLLSLLYAIRSFNLKPSKDLRNPVNDTRVAVFWENQPYIFTLRPSEPDSITVQGQKTSAQMISITTGSNPAIDQLNMRIWLGTDGRRLPLRFAIGQYDAELVSDTIVAPR